MTKKQNVQTERLPENADVIIVDGKPRVVVSEEADWSKNKEWKKPYSEIAAEFEIEDE